MYFWKWYHFPRTYSCAILVVSPLQLWHAAAVSDGDKIRKSHDDEFVIFFGRSFFCVYLYRHSAAWGQPAAGVFIADSLFQRSYAHSSSYKLLRVSILDATLTQLTGSTCYSIDFILSAALLVLPVMSPCCSLLSH